jgi:hypothetical protein
VLLVAVAVAVVAAACGGGSGGGTATGSTEPATGAGATAAVRHAYSVLFDLADPAVPPKVAVVQDGQALRATLAKEIHSSLAKMAGGATVSAVRVESAGGCAAGALSSPCASVRYSILSTAGKPLLSDSKGWAVYVDGRWLVAKETICGLIALASGGGSPPAGC